MFESPDRTLDAISDNDVVLRLSPDTRAVWVVPRNGVKVDQVDIATGQRIPPS
jgi:hypothetical protein